MANKLYASFILCILLVWITGCGKAPNPDGREDVWGSITLNGEPVLTGIIAFRSVTEEGQNGEGGGAIINGKYYLTGRDGVKPGEYKVNLFATYEYDSQTGELATLETTAERLRSVDMIPAGYGRDTTLAFTVQKGARNVFNYNVVAETPTFPGR